MSPRPHDVGRDVRRRWGERAAPPLLPGEQVLWQGAPVWRSVARRVFRVPVVAGYFVLLTLVDMAIIRAHEGPGWPAAAASVPTVLSGGACVLVLLALSWGVGRTTSYILTTERVILQFGMALPATLSIPLHRIAASSARLRRDGTGDIALHLKERGGLGFAKLWPHVRPWRFRAPEPMLRDLPHAGALTPLLCRALAACEAARHGGGNRPLGEGATVSPQARPVAAALPA